MGVSVTTDVPPTMDELQELITDAEVDCRFCKTRLGSLIDCWTHNGGIRVMGYPKKQWVYFPCPKCGHQWALWRVLHQIQMKFMEAEL